MFLSESFPRDLEFMEGKTPALSRRHQELVPWDPVMKDHCLQEHQISIGCTRSLLLNGMDSHYSWGPAKTLEIPLDNDDE